MVGPNVLLINIAPVADLKDAIIQLKYRSNFAYIQTEFHSDRSARSDVTSLKANIKCQTLEVKPGPPLIW